MNTESITFCHDCTDNAVEVQFIASAPTLFPAEYVDEFQKCFDRTPPVPFSQIEAIIREELQRPLDDVYEYVDPAPIASASIAQVCLWGPHCYKHASITITSSVFSIDLSCQKTPCLHSMYRSREVFKFKPTWELGPL